MLVDSSKLDVLQRPPRSHRTMLVIGYLLIVATAFILANLAAVPLVLGARSLFGVNLLDANNNLAGIILTIILYMVMLAIIIIAARYILKEPLTRKLLGFVRGYRIKDALVAIAGFLIYFVLGAVVLYLVIRLVPGFNAGQAQDLGFSHLAGVTKWLVFILLCVVDPIFEETIFRGFLYGKMRQKGVPIWLATLITSAAFGAAHLQWNVGINVAVLSVMLCLAREYTGSLNASITMHGLKNAVAFVALFM